MLAVNSVLTLQTQTKILTLDFRGGIKERVNVNPDDPINSVLLRVVRFRLTAESPDGNIVLEQNDVDVAPKSKLKLVQRFPPRYEHTNVIDVSLRIERKDGKPLVLASKALLMMKGSLTQYPARGDLYQLEKAVEFVNRDDPSQVISTLDKLPAMRAGL
ncbi:hypothetical protein BKA57DRAFT_185463 [Linnemannia elongata]|nr:hypothetical protein BKA57DRAFT_185463 [Linnemannia elongata]